MNSAFSLRGGRKLIISFIYNSLIDLRTSSQISQTQIIHWVDDEWHGEAVNRQLKIFECQLASALPESNVIIMKL